MEGLALSGGKGARLLCSSARLAYGRFPGRLGPEGRSADADHVCDEPEMLTGLPIRLAEILSSLFHGLKFGTLF